MLNDVVMFFQRRWAWMLPLLVVAPLAFSCHWLLEEYFRRVERPALLAAGQADEITSSCAQHRSILPDRAPMECDFVLTSRVSDGTVRESYYYDDGSRFFLETRDGKWRGSGADCTIAQRAFWVEGIGFGLFFVAVVLHSFRTKHFVWLPWRAVPPMSDLERLLAIYGAVIFIAVAFGQSPQRCAALNFPI